MLLVFIDFDKNITHFCGGQVVIDIFSGLLINDHLREASNKLVFVDMDRNVHNEYLIQYFITFKNFAAQIQPVNGCSTSTMSLEHIRSLVLVSSVIKKTKSNLNTNSSAHFHSLIEIFSELELWLNRYR